MPPSYATRPVRDIELTLKRSTDSKRAAVPLDVTSTLEPSGEIASPQGPASPGPSVTVVTVPAGVSFQPVGVIARADCATARAASTAMARPERPRVKCFETIDPLLWLLPARESSGAARLHGQRPGWRPV